MWSTVEAVAWTLPVADACERAVEAVAEPVEDEACDGRSRERGGACVRARRPPPAPSCAARPSPVSWSEVTQAGMRAASQVSARALEPGGERLVDAGWQP